METSNNTGSLAARLKSWRLELKGIGLTKDDRDELQAHIEDVLEELLNKGLSEDEAWIVALHRIGEVGDIKMEYQKVAEARNGISHQFIYWIVLIFIGSQLLIIGREIFSYIFKVHRFPIMNVCFFVILVCILLRVIYKRVNPNRKTQSDILLTAVPVVVLALGFGFFSAFDAPECENENTIMANSSPRSGIYIRELVKQFNRVGTDNIYYRFKRYFNENDRDYVVLEAIGKEFCGELQLDITNAKRLQNIARVKGMSYNGSVWRGLKFDIVNSGSGVEFIFRDVDRIID